MTSNDDGLDPASLLEAARARTGLDDFGPRHFEPNLELFVESCRATAMLNEMGQRVLPRVILRHLANRLYIQHYLGTDVAAATTPPKVAVVVTGLARTGTTLLHNLLALGKGNRTLRLWQALRPMPPTAGAAFSRSALVDQAQQWLERLHELVPSFAVIHRGTADGPEECDVLLQNDFASQHLEDMVHAEDYSRWLDDAPLGAEYAFLARQLAVLGGGDGSGQWTLKSPSHLGHLDDLLAAFPSAVVVHCHRDPIASVSSHASLVGALRRAYSDHVEASVVARHVLRRGIASVERALSVRESAPPERFFDVSYESLCRDPVSIVASLYERLGRSWAAGDEVTLRRWLKENRQHQHGVHRYPDIDVGSHGGMLARGFGPYREQFGAWLGPS